MSLPKKPEPPASSDPSATARSGVDVTASGSRGQTTSLPKKPELPASSDPPATTGSGADATAAGSRGQPLSSSAASGLPASVSAPADCAQSGPPSVPFVKMEGLGNDFVVVDLRHAPLPPWLDDGAAIARLCDRHRGVGADGVLAILPPRPGVAAVARMRVRNADGSEAEMCGNGLRCVARYLFERAPSGPADPAAARWLAIETAAGVRRCELHLRPAPATDLFAGCEIEIAMGAPRLDRAAVPMLGPPAPCLDEPIQVGGETLRITAVSLGNPHAVSFVPPGVSGADLLALARRLGPQLETHPAFPQRTNVELVHRRAADDYEVVVWERGCGITQACGTGACAVAVAACRLGHAKAGRWLQLHLPGGALGVCVLPDEKDVLMRGPARTVFCGHLPTPVT